MRYLGKNQCYSEARQSNVSRVLKLTDLEIFQLSDQRVKKLGI